MRLTRARTAYADIRPDKVIVNTF